MDKTGPCPFAFHICLGNIIKKCRTLEEDGLNWNTDLGKYSLGLKAVLTLEGTNSENLHFFLARRKIWWNSAWNTVNLQKGKGWWQGTCSQCRFYYNLTTPNESCNIILRSSSLTPPNVMSLSVSGAVEQESRLSTDTACSVLPCLLSQKPQRHLSQWLRWKPGQGPSNTKHSRWFLTQTLVSEFLYTQIVHHALCENMVYFP